MTTRHQTGLDGLPPGDQLQINDLCDRFESAWQSGQQPGIDEFLRDVSDGLRAIAVRELVAIDFEYRQKRGDSPEALDYARKYTELDTRWLTEFTSGSVGTSVSTPPSATEMPLTMGEYQIVSQLGSGGMGTVYKATHRLMKRTVALKVLRKEVASDPERRKRFEREVEAAAQLSHPNIVTAHDAGEHDGTLYLICEYVDGLDLSVYVGRNGPLPFPQALECIRQAARGLEYAHQQGVIHRDIKPSNLLVTSDGTVKILDMGLARIASFDEESATRTDLTADGAVFGTVAYMAPEQARNSKQADERSDIYSLGCTLFSLLTGRQVYPGETTVEMMFAHHEQPVPVLSEHIEGIPFGFDDVFGRMLAKSPSDRFANVTEFLSGLERYESQPFTGSAEPTVAKPDQSAVSLATTVNVATAAGDSTQLPATKASRPRTGSRSLMYGLGGGALLLLLAAVIFFLSTGSDPTPPEPVENREGSDWTDLFDGKTLQDWSPNTNAAAWSIEDGAILAAGAKSSLFYTGNQTPLHNFELEADVKTAPGSNSGIYFRTSYVPAGFPDANGYEIQINNSAADHKKTGGIWKHADIDRSPVQDNEWFTIALRVEADEVTVRVNGEVTAELRDAQKRLTGDTLALQAFDEHSRVWFRNIRVRRLPSSNAVPSSTTHRVLIVVPHRNFDRSQYEKVCEEFGRLPRTFELSVASSSTAPATPRDPAAEPLNVDVLVSDADPADYATAVFIGGTPAEDIEYFDDATPWPSAAARLVTGLRSRKRIVSGVGAGVAVLSKTGAMDGRPAARPDTPNELLNPAVKWQRTRRLGCDRFVTVAGIENIPDMVQHLSRHLR